MGQHSQAFAKGGCGCLLAFAALALVAVMAGGRAHIDCGGATLLFVVGGFLGLIVLAIYKKGAREGRTPQFTAAPPRRSIWTCLPCGTDNPPEAKICQTCREPR